MYVESARMAETLDSPAQHAVAGLRDLVRRAQRGDAIAFASLHARFAKSVHAVLLARLSSSDADDGTQETFLLAWKRLASLRDPETVGAWLLAIARNLATDRLRAARSRDEPLRETPAPLERPAAERDELRERVMQHLRSLPEAYKETLTMRLVEGLSGPEIAAATGLTEGSVRVNLCRGMEMLRELLAPEGWP